MKYLLLILALIAPQMALARIGETREECDKRYGVVKIYNSGGEDILSYQKNGIDVYIRMLKGTCQHITYTKADKSSLTETELAALVIANGKDWEEKRSKSGIQFTSHDREGITDAGYKRLYIKTLTYKQHAKELARKKILEGLESKKAEGKLEGF